MSICSIQNTQPWCQPIGSTLHTRRCRAPGTCGLLRTADGASCSDGDTGGMLTMWAGDAALQDICDSNGISEDQLLHRADEVSTIEMFLMNFPRVRTWHSPLYSLSVRAS